MIKKLTYLAFFFFLGCASQKKQVDYNQSNLIPEIDVIVENINSNSEYRFIVKNQSAGTLYIHKPKQIHIERLNAGEWVKIRILDCPCGAPCAKPMEFVEIAKNSDFTLKWDMSESWCGAKNSYGIQESMKSPVPSGVYRIMVISSVDQINTKVLYKEFNIN